MGLGGMLPMGVLEDQSALCGRLCSTLNSWTIARAKKTQERSRWCLTWLQAIERIRRPVVRACDAFRFFPGRPCVCYAVILSTSGLFSVKGALLSRSRPSRPLFVGQNGVACSFCMLLQTLSDVKSVSACKAEDFRGRYHSFYSMAEQGTDRHWREGVKGDENGSVREGFWSCRSRKEERKGRARCLRHMQLSRREECVHFPRKILRVLCGFFEHQREDHFEECVAGRPTPSRPSSWVCMELFALSHCVQDALCEVMKVNPPMKVKMFVDGVTASWYGRTWGLPDILNKF